MDIPHTTIDHEGAPEHARLLEVLKEQLLIVFVKRLGGDISIPLTEVDDTGQDVLTLSIDDNKVFHFKVIKKS